ncbi:MAG TPA: hypothetical protein VL651_05045 [Bacteroidia bacterium]|nr:hypothetical protein [Bacteroidia bacterium]
MRLLFFLSGIIATLFISCTEPQTATSCSSVNYSRVKKNKTGDEPNKKHLFHFASKADRKAKRSTKRAEKGKKKEKDKTKLGKKIWQFRKNKADQADTRDQNKGVFGQTRKSGRKQKKLILKRSKHPQTDLFPKGHPG